MSSRLVSEAQGFLFKLKENNKEWKKVYAVLNGGDLIYYDSPHAARADLRLKDGVKQVVSAHAYDEFDGVNAPTGSPAYLVIETTHAKKVYCAKSKGACRHPMHGADSACPTWSRAQRPVSMVVRASARRRPTS